MSLSPNRARIRSRAHALGLNPVWSLIVTLYSVLHNKWIHIAVLKSNGDLDSIFNNIWAFVRVFSYFCIKLFWSVSAIKTCYQSVLEIKMILRLALTSLKPRNTWTCFKRIRTNMAHTIFVIMILLVYINETNFSNLFRTKRLFKNVGMIKKEFAIFLYFNRHL